MCMLHWAIRVRINVIRTDFLMGGAPINHQTKTVKLVNRLSISFDLGLGLILVNNHSITRLTLY